MSDVTTGPRWEPRTLSSIDLERVLLDALADLFGDCYRRGATTEFRKRLFRERLERLSEAATGIPLAGLPATIRRAEQPTTNGQISEVDLDAALQRFHAKYGAVYPHAARSADPEQAHNEAVQEALEAALTASAAVVPLHEVPR